MTKYQKIKTDPNLKSLTIELDAVITSQTVDHITYHAPDTLLIYYGSDLTGDEITTLDSTVSSHGS